MVYIPKSQINQNQFTQGGEWFYVKNNSSYTGFYYQMSNGKAFTGKTPNNPPNEEIYNKTPIVSSQVKTNPLREESQTIKYANSGRSRDLKFYGILTDTDYNLIRSKPQQIFTIPTPEDYKKEIFIRYFVVKINQPEYIEVNKETYDNIETKNGVWVWEDYIPFTLNWSIKGNIDRTFNNNKGSIFIAEKDIDRKGLGNYLQKNYLQYFEYQEANNLQTLGNELITVGGKDYIGDYHIHKTQGPMVGTDHISNIHSKLFYKRFYVSRRVDSLNQEGVIVTEEIQNIEYRSNSSTRGGY